jgi:hypothetical protein
MSSSRSDAIKHIGSARAYKRMSISQALEAAPAAVRNALDQADILWVKRFPEVPAREAAERLAMRSRDNPDGIIRTPEMMLAAGPLRSSQLPDDEVVVESATGWRLEFRALPVDADASAADPAHAKPREATLKDPHGTAVFSRMALSGDAHGDYLAWAQNKGYEVRDQAAFVREVAKLVEAAERTLDAQAGAPGRISRVTLRLPAEVVESLRRCSEPWGLSARVTEVVRQHEEMVRQATPELSLKQWCAVCDAHNGLAMNDDIYAPTVAWATVAAAEEFGLGKRWGIDALALANQIRELPYASAVAVCEIARRFWHSRELSTFTDEEQLAKAGARLKP